MRLVRLPRWHTQKGVIRLWLGWLGITLMAIAHVMTPCMGGKEYEFTVAQCTYQPFPERNATSSIMTVRFYFQQKKNYFGAGLLGGVSRILKAKRGTYGMEIPDFFVSPTSA